MLVDELIAGNEALAPHIDDYLHAQAIIQTLTNPSGTLTSGAGLGEPKFNVDETRFNGNWGRPQRDGPALRSVALMGYVEWLITRGKYRTAKTVVWPLVGGSWSGCPFWPLTAY